MGSTAQGELIVGQVHSLFGVSPIVLDISKRLAWDLIRKDEIQAVFDSTKKWCYNGGYLDGLSSFGAPRSFLTER